MAVVGSEMGSVGFLSSPVMSKIKLMTSNAMVARSRPKALPSELVLLCDCCCVVVELLLIVVLFSIGNLMIVASLSVSVTIFRGSIMGAVVCC